MVHEKEVHIKNVAIINVDFSDMSAGLLAKQLYEYGREKGYNVFAYFGRGQTYSADPHLVKIDSNFEVLFHKGMCLITGLQGYFSFHATKKLIQELSSNKIDHAIIIQAHGYYLNELMLFKYLKQNNIALAYVTSDEYAGLGKCCYSYNCENFIDKQCRECKYKNDYPKSLFFNTGHKIWLRKSEEYKDYERICFLGPETNLSKFRKSELLKKRNLKEVNWGIDTDLYINYEDTKDIYEKYKIPKDKILILSVAPYTEERKGIKKYFFELAKKIDDKGYHFIHVGFNVDIKSVQIPSNMTVVPFISDQKELARIYSIADAYMICSEQDTMPITCLIALSCGVPIICFYTSGLRYIAPRENKKVIHYTDEISIGGLKAVLPEIHKKDKETIFACHRYAEDHYSINNFTHTVYSELGQL